MPAPKGNKHAAKDGEKATARLEGRVQPSLKTKYDKAAHARGLTSTAWLIEAIHEKLMRDK